MSCISRDMDGCIVGPAALTSYDQAWGASHRKDDKKETTKMTLEVSLLEDLKNGDNTARTRDVITCYYIPKGLRPVRKMS